MKSGDEITYKIIFSSSVSRASALYLSSCFKSVFLCDNPQVGLSSEGKVFVLVGTSRVKCTAYVDFTVEELKQCKVKFNHQERPLR